MKTNFTLLLIFIASLINAQTSGSLDFNGSNQYITVNNSPLNTIGSGDFTVEAWVNGSESQQSNHPTIFSNRSSGSITTGIMFFFHDLWNGSQYKILSLQLDGINYKFVNNGTYNGSLLDNQCHHVAVSRIGNFLYFYADGVLFGSTVINNPSATTNNNVPVLIGEDQNTGQNFGGNISQLRIWNVGRTQAEISGNMDMSLQGDEAGLLAYWEMNEGTGQVVTDKTGQYDGILGSVNGTDPFDPAWSTDACVMTTSNCSIPTGIYQLLEAPRRCNIFWDAVPGALKYDVHYRINGEVPVVWTRVTTIDNDRSLHYLQPDTEYVYFVRPSCDGTWNFDYRSEYVYFNTANVPSARLENQLSTESFLLQPNPARDFVTVTNIQKEETQGAVYNISGQKMSIFNIEDHSSTTINVSTLSPGVYLIKIGNQHEKLVVN